MPNDLFQFLFDETEARPLTVTELNAEVRASLERQFASVWVEGEVVDFKSVGKGHWYFNLNDGAASVKCVCWAGTNFRIRFKPQNGITVRVRGRLTFWEQRGELKLTIDSLEPSGEGALRAAFEQIKTKLEREGLFADELKRPIPFLPRRVAVITSKSGAAYHDIHTVLTRRARSVSILLIPALVQGEGAADTIRRAIVGVNQYNSTLDALARIDVLIVGRGGGSAEDLWAFNDEALARAIRASEIPVISAVGHEIDWTISDLVSDLRAATPSAAAEMVAGKEEDIIHDLHLCEDRLFDAMSQQVSEATTRTEDAIYAAEASFTSKLQTTRLRFTDVSARLSPMTLKAKAVAAGSEIAALSLRSHNATRRVVNEKGESLGIAAAKLDALSPLGVLTRGYSITQTEDGSVLRDASKAKKGDKLKIRLQNGKLDAEVVSIELPPSLDGGQGNKT